MTPLVNPLLSIPSHREFHIPVYFGDDVKAAYKKQLEIKFKKVYNALNRIPIGYYAPTNKKTIIDKVQGFQKSIISIADQYLDGYPSLAYEEFSKAVRLFEIDDELTTLQQIQVPMNHTFFRIQVQRGPYKIKRKGPCGFFKYKKPFELFHPPFHKRRSVSTTRFSIPGYPSLYLSDKLQTSYSECIPEPDTDPFHAISFRNIRPLYFIDLSEERFIDDVNKFPGIKPLSSIDVSNITDHLGLYQLVIACHTKIDYVPYYKGERIQFKAEYILPQLMLQWLKHNGFAVDGIRYKSCTSERRFAALNCHYNYVLPVRRSLDKGFCPTLASLFASTETYSYLNPYTTADIENILQQISQSLVSSSYVPLL